jgi:N6-adenosine-specific RNA methylase IME4
MMSKKYNIVLADPSWSYRDKAHAGKRGVEYKYPTMKDKDIINLPVKDILADRAAIFLWITMPKLDVGLETLKTWGANFKTTAFTWVKQDKIADTFFMGGGSYTRANPELCLLGIKGKPLPRLSKGVRQLVVSHLGEHSAKPPEVRDRIVQLFGDLPRVELFARPPLIDGWQMLGRDIDGRDIREVLQELISS